VTTFSTWRRFAHLGASDRAIALRAASLLLLTSVSLRIVGFRRWKSFLDRRLPAINPSVAPQQELLAQARHLAALHSSAARHLFFSTNCLQQALSLYVLLRRSGIPAELRFGARKDAASLEAHAWLVCLGFPLNEDQGQHRHFLAFEAVNPLTETLPD
jgi:hypothetical protein